VSWDGNQAARLPLRFEEWEPGDIPFEQATKLELVVNLKTAKALGLTIPQSVLAHEDEVIQ